jgi:hypothetical protein
MVTLLVEMVRNLYDCSSVKVHIDMLNDFTLGAARPIHAATPSVLNTAEPTTVPTPRSDSVMKVAMMLTKSSGDDVAIAMKVAPATSCVRLRSGNVMEGK